jgi:hypothetical protein
MPSGCRKSCGIFALGLLWLNRVAFRPRTRCYSARRHCWCAAREWGIRYAGHLADDRGLLWQFGVDIAIERIIANDATSVYSAGETMR